MPAFNTMSESEVAAITKTRGRAPIDLTEYTEFLLTVAPGAHVRVAIGEDEDQRTVKRRIHNAAALIGGTVKYKRSEVKSEVIFQLKIDGAIEVPQTDAQAQTAQAVAEALDAAQAILESEEAENASESAPGDSEDVTEPKSTRRRSKVDAEAVAA